MSEKQLVLALFPDESAADAAVAALKAWDEVDDDVKLNAVGVLVLDEKGKVKTQKLGRRSTGVGAGVGLVLALVTPVGLLVGVLGGALLGHLHHKGLGMSSEDRDQLAADLAEGKAAVGVLVKEAEAAAVSAKLSELGGVTKVHDLSDEEAAEVDAVAPEVEAAEAAPAPEAAPEA
jgi:uncharacterized membrane protein